MKKIAFFAFVLILGQGAFSQDSLWPPLDNSPMDMAYYPVDYPLLKIKKSTIDPPMVRVIYSRPQVKGRVIFGELVEYGKVWRLGANEDTEIEFFKDARIGNTKIKKGKYSLFAIPYQDKWTIILNRDLDSWGAFAYDQKKDVLRTDVKIEKNDPVEAFTMVFVKSGNGANLVIAWENIKTVLPISF
ncbi:MAG: hypothetical protein C5B52_02400, partial [Bacteroidetes bacterium]